MLKAGAEISLTYLGFHKMKKTVDLLLSIVTCTFVISIVSPTYAYLDPGTGSLILQGIIAGLAMASFTFKMWWYKFTSLFSKPEDSIEMSEINESEEPESSALK